jgi:esterase/lipase superfamily enzyme
MIIINLRDSSFEVPKVNGTKPLFFIHGFNVDYEKSVNISQKIDDYLALDDFGLVSWPGNSPLGVLDYFTAHKNANECGKALAEKWNNATIPSFLTHSLGARVALNYAMVKEVDTLIMFAPAVEVGALVNEFKGAKIKKIFMLGSRCDSVLKFLFPIGEDGRGALGYFGPSEDEKKLISPPYFVPESLDCGHDDYLPEGKRNLWHKTLSFAKQAFLEHPITWPGKSG